jgi:hypothetical protein
VHHIAKQVAYGSHAWFTADAAGKLDVANQKPDSGSYDFVDPMGLIVSMTRPGSASLADIAEGISPEESIWVDRVAESGGESTGATLERRFLSPMS